MFAQIRHLVIMKGEKDTLNQLGFDFEVCRRPFAGFTQKDKELITKEIMPKL